MPSVTAVPRTTPAPVASVAATGNVASKPVPGFGTTITPNELGKIMILEYHLLGEEEDRWTRSYANFWADLEMLYEKGYRPVGLNDIIDNRIDIPAGTTPVVLTFDDSSPMQFRYIEGADGKPVIDPNCAVGMMERFHEKHPDFPLKATFFVLPAAEKPHDFFGQDEYKEKKLKHLVERGFEIGNHTFWHQRLDTLESDEEVYEQLARAVEEINKLVPGYQVRSFSLPLGMWPKDPSLIRSGSYNGIRYKNEMILMVSGGTTYPPNHIEFDSMRVPRIQATNLGGDFEEEFIKYYDENVQDRYISDGDPDVLTIPRDRIEHLRDAQSLQEVTPADPFRGRVKSYQLRP